MVKCELEVSEFGMLKSTERKWMTQFLSVHLRLLIGMQTTWYAFTLTTSRHYVKIDAKFTHKTRNFYNGFDFWVAARVHTPNMQIIMAFARIPYLLFCVTLVASQTECEGPESAKEREEEGFCQKCKNKILNNINTNTNDMESVVCA